MKTVMEKHGGKKAILFGATAGLFTLLFAACSQIMTAEDNSPRLYYRAWAGFKKADLTKDQFHRGLGDTFIPATVQMGKGRGLLNYLVIIPPSRRPAFIPDEFALVVYDSEKVYREIRATPTGQHYADMHWDVFEKETSKSDVPLFLTPQTKLELNQTYDVVGKRLNWHSGQAHAFIYLRKDKASVADFLADIEKKLKEKIAYKLRGRIVQIRPDYIVVYDNFPEDERSVLLEFTTAELFWHTSADAFEGRAGPDNFYGVL